MIPDFPKPHIDELLYSVIARHIWLQPSNSLKAIAGRLFASHHALAVVDLPARVGALCSAIGDDNDWNPQKFVWNNTLLPFYAPFTPPQRLARIEKDMVGNAGGAVHMRSGIMPSRIRPPSHLRFCPSCAAEERTKFGEAYWHRLHQIAGVFICPTHRMFLEHSPVRAVLRRTRHEFKPAQDFIPAGIEGIKVDENDPNHRTLLGIAQSADWLLKNNRPGNELSTLRKRYLQYAMNLGFVTGTGRVQWKWLLREFQLRFSGRLLELLQCALSAGKSDHWLARMLRRPRGVQAPIHHLLLMEFFGVTPEEFLQSEVATTIFGSGPWPCDNPVCPQHGELAINEIHYEHSHEHRRLAGLFTCPACGQTKCRVPAGDEEIAWIKDYGTLWKSELRRLWNDPSVSLRQMARRLGVDPMTVKRHASKAGLPFPRKGKRITGKNGPPKTGRVPRPSQHGAAGKQSNGGILPGGQPRKRNTGVCGPAAVSIKHDVRVVWNARDRNLCRTITQAKEILLREPGRPKRISLAAFGRQLGVLAWVQKHPTRLPLTMALLASAAESREEFAVRKIAWAASTLRSEGCALKEWRLIRRSGLRPELLQNPVIRDSIKTVLSPAHLPVPHETAGAAMHLSIIGRPGNSS